MSNSTFAAALAFVLEREGDSTITDDPRDPGGLTKYGISKRAYPSVDIRALTESDAAAIYRRDYWDATGCGNLPDALAVVHFDASVNQGPGTAAKLLQLSAGAEPDGKIGPKTLGMIQRAKPADLVAEYTARRANHYGRLPRFDTYGLGWMRRLTACQALALSFT